MHGYPNVHCETASRIAKLGRRPHRTQKFFDELQDPMRFGTDAHGPGEAMCRLYCQLLETFDEYLNYSNNPVPTQGRWKISGIGPSDAILKKVYHNNAASYCIWRKSSFSAAERIPASLQAAPDTRGTRQRHRFPLR